MTDSIRNLVVSVPTEQLAADVGALPDGVELVVWPMDAAAPRDLATRDLLLPKLLSE